MKTASILIFLVMMATQSALNLKPLQNMPQTIKNEFIPTKKSDSTIAVWKYSFAQDHLQKVMNKYKSFKKKGVKVAEIIGYREKKIYGLSMIYLKNVVYLPVLETEMLPRLFFDAIHFFKDLKDTGFDKRFDLTKSSFLYEPFSRRFLFADIPSLVIGITLPSSGNLLVTMLNDLCTIHNCLKQDLTKVSLRKYDDFSTALVYTNGKRLFALTDDDVIKFAHSIFDYSEERDAGALVTFSRSVTTDPKPFESSTSLFASKLDILLPRDFDDQIELEILINGEIVDTINVKGKSFFVFFCKTIEGMTDSKCIDIRNTEQSSARRHSFVYDGPSKPVVNVVSYCSNINCKEHDLLEIYISDEIRDIGKTLFDSESSRPKRLFPFKKENEKNDFLIYCINNKNEKYIYRVRDGVAIEHSKIILAINYELPASMKFSHFTTVPHTLSLEKCFGRFNLIKKLDISSHELLFFRKRKDLKDENEKLVMGVVEQTSPATASVLLECKNEFKDDEHTIINYFDKTIKTGKYVYKFDKPLAVVENNKKIKDPERCVELLDNEKYQFRVKTVNEYLKKGFLNINSHRESTNAAFNNYSIVYTSMTGGTEFSFKSLSDKLDELNKPTLFVNCKIQNVATVTGGFKRKLEVRVFYSENVTKGFKPIEKQALYTSYIPNGLEIYVDGILNHNQRVDFSTVKAMYLSETEVIYAYQIDRLGGCKASLDFKVYEDKHGRKEFIYLKCNYITYSTLTDRKVIRPEILENFYALKVVRDKLLQLYPNDKKSI